MYDYICLYVCLQTYVGLLSPITTSILQYMIQTDRGAACPQRSCVFPGQMLEFPD